ncbi:MAG TPA: DUF5658 family protein [Candidatus Dormibacteraeota bacterium]|jgi:hypothetical protein
MSVGTGSERRVRRVGVGLVELVAEPRVDRSLETVKANLRDRVVLFLLTMLLAAQTADIVTTAQALASHRYVEENPLFRVLLTRSPLAAYTVKLLIVGWLALLAVGYLRGRRVATALLVAAALSLAAPVMNVALLLHG